MFPLKESSSKLLVARTAVKIEWFDFRNNQTAYNRVTCSERYALLHENFDDFTCLLSVELALSCGLLVIPFNVW